MSLFERKRSARDQVVLLVDDEPAILGAIRRALRNEAYVVVTVAGAQEALATLKEQAVDLIITDQRMPGMCGTELLEVVRSRFPKTARALLTGYTTPSTLRKGLEAGSDSFLYKPWKDDVLIKTIRRLLGKGGGTSRERDSDPFSAWIDLGGEGG